MFLRFIKGLTIFLIIFGFNFAIFSSARAIPYVIGTFYVNGSTGNDTYDGTSPTHISGSIGPRKTIQAMINIVAAGSTVIVAPGTYEENITISRGIYLRSTSNDFDVSVENQTTITDNSSISFSGNPSDIKIRGFVFDGVTNSYDILLNSAGNNTTIEYNNFTNSGTGFAAIINGIANAHSGLIIRNNSISNISNSSAGISINGFSAPQIYNNSIETLDGTAIAVVNCNNASINSNSISSITGAFGIGIGLYTTTGNMLRNDLFNGEVILNTCSMAGNLNVKYNTIYDATTPSSTSIIVFGNSVSHLTISNNNFTGSAIGVANSGVGIIDARNNWWGSSSGPHSDSSNPNGTGASVSDNVTYNPYNLNLGWNSGIQGQGNVVYEVIGGVLFRAIRRMNNTIFLSYTVDNLNWTDVGSSGNSIGNPALKLFSIDAKLHETVRSSGNLVKTRLGSDPFAWNGWTTIGNGAVSDIAMMEFDSKLWIAYRGNSGNFYIRSSSNGTTWSELTALGKGTGNLDFSTIGDRLVVSICGTNGYLYTKSTLNGASWTSWKKSIPISSDIRTVTFNAQLYQSVRTQNGKAYIRSSSDGINWAPWASGESAFGNVTVTASSGFIYQSKRGYSKTIYYRISPNGYNWSSWYSTGKTSVCEDSLAILHDELLQSYINTQGYIYTSYGKQLIPG